MVGARFGWTGLLALWLIGCDGGGGKDTDTDTDAPVETTDTVETTETVDTPDTPDTVETVDTPDTVETSDTVETPDTVETTETPDTVETSVDTTETPDTPVDTVIDTPPVDTVVDTPPIDTPPIDTPVDTVETILPDTDTDTDTDTDLAETVDTPVDLCAVIPQIQQGLIAPGTTVSFDGVIVTATLEDAVFVQCPEGGPYSGIFVYAGQPAASRLYIEAMVAINGVVEEVSSPSGSLTRINTTGAGGSIAAYLARPVPLPERVTIDELADPATAEPWEGVLVSLRDPRVWEVEGPAAFFVGDADAQVAVSNLAYARADLVYGDHIGELVGVLQWQNDRFELIPRGQGDYQTILINQTGIDGTPEGALVITEWMVAPLDAGCTDATGEYLEVTNVSNGELDLDGLILYDFESDSQYQVRGHWLVPAGDRVVLTSSGSDNCYALPTVAGFGWVHGPAPIGIGLFTPTDPLDVLFTFGWAFPSGASLELSESRLDALSNDVRNAWCDAASPFGLSDLGTPGEANDCP